MISDPILYFATISALLIVVALLLSGRDKVADDAPNVPYAQLVNDDRIRADLPRKTRDGK